MKQDLLDFVDGINAYIAEARSDPDKMPVEYPALGKQLEDWKPTDTVAIASLIGGIFGKGGGEEARVSLALPGDPQALRPPRGPGASTGTSATSTTPRRPRRRTSASRSTTRAGRSGRRSR